MLRLSLLSLYEKELNSLCSPRGKSVRLYDPEGGGGLCLGGLELAKSGW